MRDAQAELAAGIRQLLNEWDFIGVYDPEINIDEYDCLIGSLRAMLAGGAATADISRYLHSEIEGHFGMTSTYLGVQPFSERLHAWWHSQPDHDHSQPIGDRGGVTRRTPAPWRRAGRRRR
jgi:hypothetical protein